MVISMDLVGKQVTEVRQMTQKEAYNWGIGDNFAGTTVLVFSDGSQIFASADHDGNERGYILGLTAEGIHTHV